MVQTRELMLRQAERLLAGLSTSCPTALPLAVIATAWGDAVTVLRLGLSAACYGVDAPMGGHAASRARVRHLPRITAALESSVGEPDEARRVLALFTHLLSSQLDFNASGINAAALLTAADSCLRLLPLLRMLQQQHAERAPPAALELVSFWQQAVNAAAAAVSGEATGASELPAATAAARATHTRSCQLVHWLPQTETGGPLPNLACLLSGLNFAGHAASVLLLMMARQASGAARETLLR